MIHVDSVTAALSGLMAGDPVLVSSGFTVQEGEAFNRDPNLTPWVGIYYGSLHVDPHTLGGVTPWQGELELFLYVQEGSHRSGEEATRLLSRAQACVLDILNANKTLGGAVLVFTGIEIAPFQRDLSEDTWLFSNEISLRATVRA
jgi:hypothetical protein